MYRTVMLSVVCDPGDTALLEPEEVRKTCLSGSHGGHATMRTSNVSSKPPPQNSPAKPLPQTPWPHVWIDHRAKGSGKANPRASQRQLERQDGGRTVKIFCLKTGRDSLQNAYCTCIPTRQKQKGGCSPKTDTFTETGERLPLVACLSQKHINRFPGEYGD